MEIAECAPLTYPDFAQHPPLIGTTISGGKVNLRRNGSFATCKKNMSLALATDVGKKLDALENGATFSWQLLTKSIHKLNKEI